MILSGPHASAQDVERFCLEARSAANLDHPNIVPVYDIGQQGKQHYFTMAYIDGDSLGGLSKKKGLLSFPASARIVRDLAEALQYAHENGIIHRDLKPENILIDRQGRPRITDFGLAKRLTVDSGLTAAGQVMGTPSYMAPEQARGSDELGPAVDIYALGGILYFLLTGRPPFLGKTLMEVLSQVVHEDPTPPQQVNPSVPAELAAICLKCLAKDPAQRYATAGGLAADLRVWASQCADTVPVPQPSTAREQAVLPSGGGAGRKDSHPAPPDRLPALDLAVVAGSEPAGRWSCGRSLSRSLEGPAGQASRHQERASSRPGGAWHAGRASEFCLAGEVAPGIWPETGDRRELSRTSGRAAPGRWSPGRLQG